MSKRSRVCHVEWRSRNIDRLKQFYKSAFNWKFKDPMPGYAVANTGNDELRGGFMQIESGSNLQPGLQTFFASDDLAASEAAIRDAGGQVISSSQPVEGWGRFTIFSDPDGNHLALWQSDESVKKQEKGAKRAAKKAAQKREIAERAEAKARTKAEKKAQKQARKAEKQAKKAAGQQAESKQPKADKQKKKKKEAGAEAQV
jgi:predicted enzyme related to lactoylglutathione lyase